MTITDGLTATNRMINEVGKGLKGLIAPKPVPEKITRELLHKMHGVGL